MSGTQTFSFTQYPCGKYSRAVELGSVEYGWANFEDHWESEHTAIVPVPYDLDAFGIDTTEKDGVTLFVCGQIAFDSHNDTFVYVKDMEPSLCGRYLLMDERRIVDRLPSGDDAVIFAIMLD